MQRGAPVLGHCPSQVSEGGQQGSSPQQACHSLPSWPGPRGRTELGAGPFPQLRSLALTLMGKLLGLQSRKEPGQTFSNQTFT